MKCTIAETKAYLGRAAHINPPNRFEKTSRGETPSELSEYFQDPEPERNPITTFYADRSKTVLASNDSPDIFYSYSVNPYRGCEHGCIYCYARPSHEYLGFSSGLDFETKIMVKYDVAELLEREFRRRSWKPQVVALSGNTDCYQPIERKLRLTRRCLEVFLKARNPVVVTTKNALVLRDLDIFKELASFNCVSVGISITTLREGLARKLEPRTSTPQKRLDTIQHLALAGIPVGVNAAPMIPGLTDSELSSILKQASDCGARFASYSILRLPYAVREIFQDWLKREVPSKLSKILSQLKDIREGKLNCSEFGKRLSGKGEYASMIRQVFETSIRKYHLNEETRSLSTEHFRPPGSNQIDLFR
ncbi:MAG: PA0069 family radical SAM protein [bacterium]